MKKTHSINNFIHKYFFLILPVVYGILYMCAFYYVEHRYTPNLYIVHMAIDDYIPFCEFFVIPYFMWFGYIAITVLVFMFLDRSDYYKLCVMLGVGMTLFLIISYLIPNGHMLRPDSFERDNIFVHMVQSLYKVDTPTNLFPSIHCYNSIVAHIAISRSRQLKNKKWIQTGSFILCVSIILSTVFIKQHSVFDLLTAFGLAAIMYAIVYGRKSDPVFKKDFASN